MTDFKPLPSGIDCHIIIQYQIQIIKIIGLCKTFNLKPKLELRRFFKLRNYKEVETMVDNVFMFQPQQKPKL